MEIFFKSPEFSREISLLKHPIPQLQFVTSLEISKFLISLAKSKFDLNSQIPFKLFKNDACLKEIIQNYSPKITKSLYLNIYTDLLDKGFIQKFRISCSPEILEKLVNTRHYLENSLWKIDASLSIDNPTHILYPVKLIQAENSTEWYRTVDKRFGLKTLHYWYTPDSKDVYVQDLDIHPDPDLSDLHNGPWHLSLNWLLDSIKYQEWMNELDYEIDEEEKNSLKQEYSNLSADEVKLKDEEFTNINSMLVDEIEFQEDEEMEYLSEKEKNGSDASFNQSDDDAESEDEEIEDDDDSDFLLGGKDEAQDDKSGSEELNSEALSLSAVTSSKPLSIIKELPLYSIVDLERKAPARYKKQGYDPVEDGEILNISHSILELDSFLGNNRERSPRKWLSPDQELSETDKEIIIKVLNSSPIFSGIKEIDEIDPIESDAFPSFCGKDATYVNRQVFRDIRNAMILAYATDPYSELTVTECYKHLRYDIHDLSTVHNFLCHFHFINTRNVGRAIPRTPFSQDFGTLYETKGLIKNWIYSDCKTVQDISPHSPGKPVLLESCFFCGTDITWRPYYSSRKFSEFSLCLACFADGRFPADMSSRDFIHVSGVPIKENDENLEKTEDNWTDEEILKLLEGIEKYDLSWYNISETVGTKSAQQCLFRFYQDSIDDQILFDSLCKESRSDSELWRTIVGQSSNPLMTLLSSLCSFCPYMASESAKSALKFFGEKLKDQNADMRLLTMQAAIVAFDAALEYARSCMDDESNLIKNRVYQLSEKQIERVTLKLKLLEDFVNHQRNSEPKIPEQQR